MNRPDYSHESAYEIEYGGQRYACRPYGQPQYPEVGRRRGYDAGKTFLAATGGTLVGAVLSYYILKQLQKN